MVDDDDSSAIRALRFIVWFRSSWWWFGKSCGVVCVALLMGDDCESRRLNGVTVFRRRGGGVGCEVVVLVLPWLSS